MILLYRDNVVTSLSYPAFRRLRKCTAGRKIRRLGLREWDLCGDS